MLETLYMLYYTFTYTSLAQPALTYPRQRHIRDFEAPLSGFAGLEYCCFADE
jgi:hypothetical protein